MMPFLNYRFGGYDLGFLMSEGPGRSSREQGVVAAAARVAAGAAGIKSATVLGRITATGKLVPLAPAANDGSQNVAGILALRIKPGSSDRRVAYVARQAEVRGLDLIWPAGITTNQKQAAIAQLQALFIEVRV